MKIKMKTIAVLSGILSLGAVSAASAADMAVKAQPLPPPPPIFTWTGFYIGLNAGGAWTRSEVDYTQTGAYLGTALADQAFSHALGSTTTDRSGFTGGGQFGYNWQVGMGVFGIETDINYLHTSATRVAAGVLPVAGAIVSSASTVETDWLYTLRGRAGIAAGQALFYATGGLAVGNVKFAQAFFHAASGSFEVGAVESTQAGWTVGGGIEYAFNNNWSVKGEYLYVDLGTVGFNSANTLFPTFTASHSARLTENIGRVGINYRFGGPVVARY
jgi:outer membrane immunogenic protein